MEVTAFRIVQQALDNVAAHARAGHARVEIVFTAEMLNLIVRDDGIGFTPPDQPTDLARQGHFGLIGMYERALLYGGQLAITSSPGAGTTITKRSRSPAETLHSPTDQHTPCTAPFGLCEAGRMALQTSSRSC